MPDCDFIETIDPEECIGDGLQKANANFLALQEQLCLLADSIAIGLIVAYPTPSPPEKWLLCDGSYKNPFQYPKLYQKIGTTFGSLDINGNFKLPDSRSRTHIGTGTGVGLTARVLGLLSGAETVALTSTQIAAHTHTLDDPMHAHTGTVPHTHTVSRPAHGSDDGTGHALTIPAHNHNVFLGIQGPAPAVPPAGNYPNPPATTSEMVFGQSSDAINAFANSRSTAIGQARSNNRLDGSGGQPNYKGIIWAINNEADNWTTPIKNAALELVDLIDPLNPNTNPNQYWGSGHSPHFWRNGTNTIDGYTFNWSTEVIFEGTQEADEQWSANITITGPTNVGGSPNTGGSVITSGQRAEGPKTATTTQINYGNQQAISSTSVYLHNHTFGPYYYSGSSGPVRSTPFNTYWISSVNPNNAAGGPLPLTNIAPRLTEGGEGAPLNYWIKDVPSTNVTEADPLQVTIEPRAIAVSINNAAVYTFTTSATAPTITISTHTTGITINSSSAQGAGQPHDNMQPHLVLSYIIKFE